MTANVEPRMSITGSVTPEGPSWLKVDAVRPRAGRASIIVTITGPQGGHYNTYLTREQAAELVGTIAQALA